MKKIKGFNNVFLEVRSKKIMDVITANNSFADVKLNF